MPIVSLFTPAAAADAWHQVTAPGGYEWWYFDAEDEGGDLRMVAIFFEGFVFHPGYLRKFDRYSRRPTRVAPPLPSEYPCVYFVLYRGKEIVSQFMSEFPAGSLVSSPDRVDVTIDENRLKSVDGTLQFRVEGVPWVLTGRGPKHLHSQKLSAQFTFTPKSSHEPMQRRFFARQWSKADHHWVIANPLCDVTGEVELLNSETNTTQRFVIRGPGYHDHNYGTGPIGPGLKRWMWGRVLMKDHAVMFHYAQPRNLADADEVNLIETDQLEMRELPVDRFQADWSRRTGTLLPYPAWVEAGAMQLVKPQVIDASPFYLRLSYDASIRGVSGRAFCEIAYPSRLRWPVLGRMIEMSIRKTDLQDMPRI